MKGKTHQAKKGWSGGGSARYLHALLFAFRFSLLGVWALLLGLSSCASISPLQGGPKDETPPKVVVERSTPNFQTALFPKSIELTFDEWITLDDVFNQVVISPPLEYRPDIALKGRTVIVKLDDRERLRPDATYTINFGTAIKDLTERNPADELRFVFSTGTFIDSLSVEGIITDALSGEPVEKALFMLYDNLADSVVRTERPFYFGRTGKDGRFRIPNVRSDTLKGFALLDADLNYRFNQSKEKIGFPNGLIVIADSSAQNIRIRLFEEARPLRLLESDATAYGRVKFTYSHAPQSFSAVASASTQNLLTEYLNDTIRVWYNKDVSTPWTLTIQADSTKADSLEVKPAQAREEFLSKAKLALLLPVAGAMAVIHPDQPATLTFNHPVLQIDTSRIFWREDTIRKQVFPNWSPDSAQIRSWTASWKWMEGIVYEMEALPGAFTDIFGLSNADTLSIKWRIDLRKNYATLNLLLEDMDSDAQYVVYLLNNNKTEVLSRRVSGSDEGRLSLSALQPGLYALRILLDRNGNGRWDSGFYDTGLQPEETFQFPLEQLRSNWEMEARVSLKSKE